MRDVASAGEDDPSDQGDVAPAGEDDPSGRGDVAPAGAIVAPGALGRLYSGGVSGENRDVKCPLAAWVVAAAITVTCLACKRGALSEWMREHDVVPTTTATPMQRLSGVDCPDGLARCVAGTVEASQVKRVPRPCPPTLRPDECICPWKSVGVCAAGCAAEGAEVVVEEEHALARLCAPDPAHPVARQAPGVPAPQGACEAVGYRCVASLVVVCALGDAGALESSVAAACLRGCVHEGEALGEEEADPASAPRILCAR